MDGAALQRTHAAAATGGVAIAAAATAAAAIVSTATTFVTVVVTQDDGRGDRFVGRLNYHHVLFHRNLDGGVRLI